VVMVDRPQAVQTVIRIANTVQLVPGSPDYIPSTVMNTILGASDARLFDNLRETHGYTYGAYSSLTKDPLVGQFRAYAQVRNAVTDSAIREFFYELNRIRDTLVPADELQGVQNYLNGTFSISLQNPQTVAGFYIDQERYRMSPTYYRNYLQDLAQVDQEAVQSMARKMIQPGSCVVLCVGKGSEIAPKLRSMDSDGVIEWLDWNGETAPDPTALKLPEGTTLASVLEKYIANTGGAKNWSKLKGLRTTMAATLQGMNLEMVQIKRSKPAASLTKVRLNSSMELSSDLYLNGKMSRKSMQGTKEVEGEELAHEAMEATPLPEMVWLNGVHSKLSLAGAVMVDGQLCAKLDWKFENGTLESHVYNLQTGLKIQSTRVSKGPDGKDALSTTAYADYRDMGKGLQIPHKVKISMGPESIEFNLTEGTLNPRLSDADFKH
jgi:zinc protease